MNTEVYSVYLDVKDVVFREKITTILEENNIAVETVDIFNSDFAIIDYVINYTFPHIVITKDYNLINTNNILKNETIDFIYPSYPINIIKMKILNAIYFVQSRGSRGSFKQKVSSEINKLERSGGTFSLAMISIIDFYKHEKLLNNISLDDLSNNIYKLIKITTRKSDDLVKLSRKEFGIIFPFTEMKNAENACERIKRRSIKIQSNIPLRLAFGLTEIQNPNENINEALDKLKKALYISEANSGEISIL